MNTPTNQTPPKWLGPLMMAIALFIVFQKTSAGVPQWIGTVAALCIFLGGFTATEIALGYPQIANFMGPVLVVCLAIIPTWIAFGPGDRHCSGGLSILGFLVHQPNAGQIECRIAFGFGAVMMWAIFIFGVWYTLNNKKK